LQPGRLLSAARWRDLVSPSVRHFWMHRAPIVHSASEDERAGSHLLFQGGAERGEEFRSHAYRLPSYCVSAKPVQPVQPAELNVCSETSRVTSDALRPATGAPGRHATRERAGAPWGAVPGTRAESPRASPPSLKSKGDSGSSFLGRR